MPWVTHSIIDHSEKVSPTRHFLPTITAANYAAITGNGVGQNVGDLRLALGAITEGNFVRHQVMDLQALFTNPITDPNAQREMVLVLHCIDSAANKFTIEIPTIDLSKVAQSGTDIAVLTDPDVDDFLTQLITGFRSPQQNTFIVEYGRIAGRNR